MEVPKDGLHTNQPTMELWIWEGMLKKPTEPSDDRKLGLRNHDSAIKTLLATIIPSPRGTTIPRALNTVLPPKVAGEKLAPQATVRAEPEDKAQARVASQSNLYD